MQGKANAGFIKYESRQNDSFVTVPPSFSDLILVVSALCKHLRNIDTPSLSHTHTHSNVYATKAIHLTKEMLFMQMYE